MNWFRFLALRNGTAALGALTAASMLAVPLYSPSTAAAEATPSGPQVIILGRDWNKPCDLNGARFASGTVVETQVKDVNGRVHTIRIRCEDGNWVQL